jgi:hypothetical protein
MASKLWNGKRTLEHCGLITKCVKGGIGKPKQYDGVCEGYQKSETDDEPCTVCAACKLWSGYEPEVI